MRAPISRPGGRLHRRGGGGQPHVLPAGRHHLDQAPGVGRALLAEVVATLGLLLVIFALARPGGAALAPAAVGAYIGAAYFFTSSTSFANPAITVGRMFSNTFAGIAPSSVPVFRRRPSRRRRRRRRASSGRSIPRHPGRSGRHRVPPPRPSRGARSDRPQRLRQAAGRFDALGVTDPSPDHPVEI